MTGEAIVRTPRRPDSTRTMALSAEAAAMGKIHATTWSNS